MALPQDLAPPIAFIGATSPSQLRAPLESYRSIAERHHQFSLDHFALPLNVP
jgi:hypothetical protein